MKKNEISDQEIRKAIETLENAKLVGTPTRFLDKAKYRGKGRPRKMDYYWRQIDWEQTIEQLKMVYK